MQNKNRGAAMVEFALVAPFFFMLMACIIYGAMVMHDYNSLNEITRNTARYGSVIESGTTDNVSSKESNMKAFARAKAENSLFIYELKSGDDGVKVNANKDVEVGTSGNTTQEKSVYVELNAQMQDGMPKLFLDYFPDSLKTITSKITMRRED